MMRTPFSVPGNDPQRATLSDAYARYFGSPPPADWSLEQIIGAMGDVARGAPRSMDATPIASSSATPRPAEPVQTPDWNPWKPSPSKLPPPAPVGIVPSPNSGPPDGGPTGGRAPLLSPAGWPVVGTAGMPGFDNPTGNGPISMELINGAPAPYATYLQPPVLPPHLPPIPPPPLSDPGWQPGDGELGPQVLPPDVTPPLGIPVGTPPAPVGIVPSPNPAPPEPVGVVPSPNSGPTGLEGTGGVKSPYGPYGRPLGRPMSPGADYLSQLSTSMGMGGAYGRRQAPSAAGSTSGYQSNPYPFGARTLSQLMRLGR